MPRAGRDECGDGVRGGRGRGAETECGELGRVQRGGDEIWRNPRRRSPRRLRPPFSSTIPTICYAAVSDPYLDVTTIALTTVDESPPLSQILAGTLDLLVLKTLSAGPFHGYGLAQHIKRLSRDALRVEEGSLYPALQRVPAKGWIASELKKSPDGENGPVLSADGGGATSARRRGVGVPALGRGDDARSQGGRAVTPGEFWREAWRGFVVASSSVS